MLRRTETCRQKMNFYVFASCVGLSGKDKGGLTVTFDALFDVLEKLDKDVIVTALVALDKYVPGPLPEGEEPFDISYVRGLRALGSMVVLGPVEGLGLTLAAWRWLPRAVYEAYRAIWRVRVEGAAPRVLKLAVGILIVPTTSLAVIATPPIGFLFGLGDVSKEAYTNGFAPAPQTPESITRLSSRSSCQIYGLRQPLGTAVSEVRR